MRKGRGEPLYYLRRPRIRTTRPLLCIKPLRIILSSRQRGITRVGGGFGAGLVTDKTSQITHRLELVSRRWVQMHTNIYADRDHPKGRTVCIKGFTRVWLHIEWYLSDYIERQSGEICFVELISFAVQSVPVTPRTDWTLMKSRRYTLKL